MANSTWTIFPPVPSSRCIDVLAAETICDLSHKHIDQLLTRHLFSQSIQILSQDGQLFETLHKFVLESNELGFLLLRNMPLYTLICPHFLNAFCRKGSLYGVSINRDVNLDDTVALLPNQTLLLSVNARTYYQLGIIGQKSTLNRKKNLMEKYRITIELGKDCFKPDKKNYQRTFECLKRSQLKCDFIIKWDPHETSISANALEKYFQYILDNGQHDKLLSKMTLQKCYPTLRTYVNRSASTFSYNNIENSEEFLNEFIEWASAQVAEVKWESGLVDDEVQSFSDVYCAELRGFFISSNIIKLLTALKICFTTNAQTGAIIVHGFENSPQCWSGRNNEHYKDVSGDNIIGIGQFDKKVISWSIADRFDYGIEKL